MCESGFGYDVAMIVASFADLTEGLNADLHSAAAFLQKQVKYGLADQAAIAFHEAGFADRFVASLLGFAWPHVADRAGVRMVCRREPNAVRASLASLPSYFTSVTAELGA